MDNELRREIKLLEDDVCLNEQRIEEALSRNDYDSIQEYTLAIHSDLKYLNIIVNGSPLDLRECQQIMDFIRTHYENLWRIPARL